MRTWSTIMALGMVLICAACSGSPTTRGSGSSPSSSAPRSTASATPSRTQTASPTASASPTPSATPSPSDAGVSLQEKVGQLFMVGVSLSQPAQASYDAVRELHVGNVFLQGRTSAGIQPVRNLVNSLTKLAPANTGGLPMFVAADQEGGLVQSLKGPGFDTIPSAMQQAGLSPAALQAQAQRWGEQLSAAGVNLDLAPVMDLVPSAASAAKNPPIGAYDRNYGYSSASVIDHANAFSAGLRQAQVGVAIKHFPGLGAVPANTDTTANVHDQTTTANGPSVQIFKAGIDAGAPFVMMSTAIYDQIDPTSPAAFSPKVVGLLRDQGFDGVVITDDVSGTAQVAAWSPGERAVQAISAGCDMILVSSKPSQITEMVNAVVDRAQTDAAFAAKVNDAYEKVRAAKSGL